DGELRALQVEVVAGPGERVGTVVGRVGLGQVGGARRGGHGDHGRHHQRGSTPSRPGPHDAIVPDGGTARAASTASARSAATRSGTGSTGRSSAAVTPLSTRTYSKPR